MKRDYITTALREDQRERSEAIYEMPARNTCVCRNEHKPIDGIIYTNPACQKHGLRGPYLIGVDAFGGYMALFEDERHSKPAQHRVRLPINSEPLSADARLTEAMRKYGQRLAARVNQ